MSKSENEAAAQKALEILAQAYAYYTPPLRPVAKGQAEPSAETYFEYVKAA